MKHRICLVLSRKVQNTPVVLGTGFLVAPDLVLTCRHVLKDFAFPPPCNVHSDGARIEICFDFMDGDPVQNFNSVMPGARKVGLHANWHVASSKDFKPDGLTGTLTPQQISDIQNALDFVLLRLDTKVGLQPVDIGGGRRRGWVTLPDNAIPRRLDYQDRILIPQHPHGWPLRIDFGRYEYTDVTETRIRYQTNTAHGSSGAPCFDQTFSLVGMHNAFVGPPGMPTANQAIRLDRIADHVRGDIDAAVKNHNLKDTYTLRWSVARTGESPRVVLGREKLLTWLRDSATATPRYLADRVYVARAEEPDAGCSFSLDVLHAETRDSKAPRAVYAKVGQLLPSTAEDFLLSLLRELGIKSDVLQGSDAMPPRPATETDISSQLAGEVDKVERWLSDELPAWMGSMIVKHGEKTIDRKQNAQDLVAKFKEGGWDVPPDILAVANSPGAVEERVSAWDCAYVVIDHLRVASYAEKGDRTNLEGEVLSLIAALLKGKPEEAMHPGLLKLRWMFLGYLPDFLPQDDGNGNGAVLEELDPAAVGVDEITAMFVRMAKADLKMGDVPQGTAVDLIKTILNATAELLLQASERGDGPRMVELQRAVSGFSAKLLRMGVPDGGFAIG